MKMKEDILNAGLALALEWGENWLQPIQERLHRQCPKLGEAELDEYNTTCREAMDFGHNHVPDCWRQSGEDQKKAYSLWEQEMKSRYPWISKDNLSHTFSQGCYYAWKDGEM